MAQVPTGGMTIVAFCNHKGGTGKTTSSVCVGAALGQSGYRVLVVDLDPQGFLSRFVGVDEPPEAVSSMMLFEPEVPATEIPVVFLRWFDLIPSTGRLSKLLRTLTKATDVLWLRESLQDDLPYDVVIVDTAAAVTVFSLNALAAADSVVVPVVPEYQAVAGAEQTHRSARTVARRLNPAMKSLCFLLTQVDARKKTHHQYRKYLRDRYGDDVLRSVVRTSAALSASHFADETVFDYAPTSRGAVDYANVTDELITLWGLPRPQAEKVEAYGWDSVVA